MMVGMKTVKRLRCVLRVSYQYADGRTQLQTAIRCRRRSICAAMPGLLDHLRHHSRVDVRMQCEEWNLLHLTEDRQMRDEEDRSHTAT
jgi:hypothetical protein